MGIKRERLWLCRRLRNIAPMLIERELWQVVSLYIALPSLKCALMIYRIIDSHYLIICKWVSVLSVDNSKHKIMWEIFSYLHIIGCPGIILEDTSKMQKS